MSLHPLPAVLLHAATPDIMMVHNVLSHNQILADYRAVCRLRCDDHDKSVVMLPHMRIVIRKRCQ